MQVNHIVARLEEAVSRELKENILPFWIKHTVDEKHGGFVGRIDNANNVIPDADKSAILNARILWSFSSLFNALGDQQHLKLASRAYDYIITNFQDPEYGGFYWTLDYTGHPVDARKHLYVQAFILYGLSEYQKATSDPKVLEQCTELFQLLENHCYDEKDFGYHEVFSPHWKALKDVSLGSDEQAARFTMNSHLHLMEAYTNLYKINPDERLRNQLQFLVELHFDKMYDPASGHFYSFFLEEWQPQTGEYSYGHDIEAVWLLYDAITELNNPELADKINNIIGKVADLTLREGIDEQCGGIYNTGENGNVTDTDKQWWSQVEGMLGFGYAWKVTGKPEYVQAIDDLWKFISDNFIDRNNGEWYFRVRKDGSPYLQEDKVGPWKGPYHTVRGSLLFGDIAAVANAKTSEGQRVDYQPKG